MKSSNPIRRFTHPLFTAIGLLVNLATAHGQSFLTNGLVAYYPLNGSPEDAAGTNHGLAYNVVTASDRRGNFNGSLFFNGTNSYIRCPDKGLPTGNNPRTISLWANFRSYGTPTPADPAFFTYGSGQANDTCYLVLFGLSRPNQPVAVGRSGGGDAPLASGTLLNRWYHIAFTHDGATTRLYIDGIHRGAASRTYVTALDGKMYIGSYTHVFGPPPPTHHGEIDELRIYNRAMTSNEVALLYQFESGKPASFITNSLAAYYPFDGTALDRSGNSNHAIVFGASLATNRFSKAQDSYSFGNGNYIKTTNSYGFPVSTSDFSVTLWVTLDRQISTDWQVLVCNQALDQFQIGLQPFAGGLSGVDFYIGGDGPDFQSPDLNWETNRWYQIALVRSNNTLRLYRDGISVHQGSVTQGNNVTAGNAALSFGYRNSNNNHPLFGQLDDIRIYRRALSADEISLLNYYERPSTVVLVKSYTVDFEGLTLGGSYQMQVSSNLTSWSNWGFPFTATSERYTNAIPHQRVDDWSRLFFRLQQQ